MFPFIFPASNLVSWSHEASKCNVIVDSDISVAKSTLEQSKSMTNRPAKTSQSTAAVASSSAQAAAAAAAAVTTSSAASAQPAASLANSQSTAAATPGSGGKFSNVRIKRSIVGGGIDNSFVNDVDVDDDGNFVADSTDDSHDLFSMTIEPQLSSALPIFTTNHGAVDSVGPLDSDDLVSELNVEVSVEQHLQSENFSIDEFGTERVPPEDGTNGDSSSLSSTYYSTVTNFDEVRTSSTTPNLLVDLTTDGIDDLFIEDEPIAATDIDNEQLQNDAPIDEIEFISLLDNRSIDDIEIHSLESNDSAARVPYIVDGGDVTGMNDQTFQYQMHDATTNKSTSLPQRILVNVSIATDNGDGSQLHAVYMLHVSVPATEDFDSVPTLTEVIAEDPKRIEGGSAAAAPVGCQPPEPPPLPKCPCECGGKNENDSKYDVTLMGNASDLIDDNVTELENVTDEKIAEDAASINEGDGTTSATTIDVDQTTPSSSSSFGSTTVFNALDTQRPCLDYQDIPTILVLEG